MRCVAENNGGSIDITLISHPSKDDYSHSGLCFWSDTLRQTQSPGTQQGHKRSPFAGLTICGNPLAGLCHQGSPLATCRLCLQFGGEERLYKPGLGICLL